MTSDEQWTNRGKREAKAFIFQIYYLLSAFRPVTYATIYSSLTPHDQSMRSFCLSISIPESRCTQAFMIPSWLVPLDSYFFSAANNFMVLLKMFLTAEKINLDGFRCIKRFWKLFIKKLKFNLCPCQVESDLLFLWEQQILCYNTIFLGQTSLKH